MAGDAFSTDKDFLTTTLEPGSCGLSLGRVFWIARSFVFTGLLILVIQSQFLKTPLLSESVGILALLSWILALLDSDRSSKTISILLFAAGSLLFGIMRVPLSVVIGSFAENTNILMVMVLVPILAIIIDLGGYSQPLSIISSDVKSPIFLFMVASFLTYALGAVLLNAAIALVWAIMTPIVVKIGKEPYSFLASSIPRGYNASLLWTPASPSMAVALGLTGISWGSLFVPGLVLSLVMLGVATLVEMKNERIVSCDNTSSDSLLPSQSNSPSEAGIKRIAWRKTGSLALGLFSFIASIVFLEKLGFSALQAMPLCIPAVLLVWSFLLGKPKEAAKSSLSYFSRKMPTLSNQFLLMTTAGFIGTAVKLFIQSRGSGISIPFSALSPETLGLVFTLFTSLLIWSISILGIHPIIGMTIVYSLVYPMAGTYSAPYVTMTLLLGSALGFNISPISATMLITSSCCGKNTLETGLKLQWKFVIAMWILGSSVLSLLHF